MIRLPRRLAQFSGLLASQPDHEAHGSFGLDKYGLEGCKKDRRNEVSNFSFQLCEFKNRRGLVISSMGEDALENRVGSGTSPAGDAHVRSVLQSVAAEVGSPGPRDDEDLQRSVVRQDSHLLTGTDSNGPQVTVRELILGNCFDCGP